MPIPSTLADFTAHLDHPAPEIRQWAGDQLISIYPRQAIDLLLPRFATLTIRQQSFLVQSLFDVGPTPFAETIRSLCSQKGNELGPACIHLLAQAQHPDARQLILGALPAALSGHGDPIHLIEALGHLSDPVVLPTLLELLDHPRRVVGRTAFCTLLKHDFTQAGLAFSKLPLSTLLEGLLHRYDLESWLEVLYRVDLKAALRSLEERHSNGAVLPPDLYEAVLTFDNFRDWLPLARAAINQQLARCGLDATQLSEGPQDGWRALVSLTLLLIQRIEAEPQPDSDFDLDISYTLIVLLLLLVEGTDEAILARNLEGEAAIAAVYLSPQAVISKQIAVQGLLLGPTHLPALEQAMTSGTPAVALRAIDTVGHIASTDPEACLRCLPALYVAAERVLGPDPDPAETVICRLGPGRFAAIAAELAQAKGFDALTWVDRLQAIPTAECEALFIACARSTTEPLVRRIAIQLLGNLGSESSIEFLASCVSQGDRSALKGLLVSLLLHRPRDPRIASCRRAIAKTGQSEPVEAPAPTKGPGSKELKKRKAMRKQNRRKK
jgi:hypothetical protein